MEVPEEIRNVAILYCQELVKFVIREHGILCFSAPRHDLWEGIPRLFDADVGKVVVAYAKSSLKDHLISTAGNVRTIRSEERFEKYCEEFHRLYFTAYGCSHESVLKYCVYLTEQSLLLFLEGMGRAPSIAADGIAYSLLQLNGGRFVTEGGLNELNEAASSMLASDPSLGDAYDLGQFAWCNR